MADDSRLDKDLLEIMGNMKIAVFRAGPDSRIIAVNEAGAELMGASCSAELIGRSFSEFYAEPDERRRLRQALDAEGRLLGFRFRARRLDGSLAWMESNMIARRDPQGQLAAFEGFGRDVSDLVAAEEQVRHLDKFLEVTLQTADFMITVVDLQGKVLIWNAKAEAVTGYSREEVLGNAQVWRWLYPDDEYYEWIARRTLELPHADRRELETTLRTRGGEQRTIFWISCEANDPQGQTAILALGRDVTVERALQNRLQEQETQRRAELERLVRERTAELQRANRELKLLDEMKARFLANISHELRTPLVSGLGYVNLILEGGMGRIGTRIRKGLGISRQNLERLASLIDDLLAFTQHGAGARPLRPQPFELGELVGECIQDLQADPVRARVTTSMEDALPRVLADREQIRRVLSNLLVNATKFSGEHPEIEVRARRLGTERIEVQVCDHGMGIPPGERELVFERLYRSSWTDPGLHRGTGLGLHLVREILTAHGCEVRAEGREGPGTAIVFTLPIAQDS